MAGSIPSVVAPAWLAPALLIALVLLVAVVAATLWWTTRPKPGADAAPAEDDDPGVIADVRKRLRATLNRLRKLTDRAEDPYAVPWIVVAGVAGAEAWSVVEGIPALSTDGGGTTDAVARLGTVRFCRNGVVYHAGDDLAVKAGGTGRWRRLLETTRASRRQRPIDGLVLAVPITILTGSAALPADRLAEIGARMYDLLAEVQRITGLRVPIHLIITRCEQLAGFSGLVEALPKEARDEALGWAVPYSLDTAFNPKWADEACDAIGASVWALGIQMLLVKEDLPDRDGLVTLPGDIHAMAPRLRVLLSALLQPSAYQESFLFRGVYLSGEMAEGCAFTNRLFVDKIFREYQLVKPVRGLVTARNIHIRQLQAVLAVLVVAQMVVLSWMNYRLPRNIESVTELMNEIARDLPSTTAGGPNAADQVVASTNVLRHMVQLDVVSIETPLAPTSLLTRADEQVSDAIAISYEILVLDAVRRQLDAKLPTILSTYDPERWNGGRDPMGAVAALVDALNEYKRAVESYRTLSATRSLTDLAQLVKYTLSYELGSAYFKHADLYQNALASANIKPVSPAYRDDLRNGLIEAFDHAYEMTYNAERMARTLANIGVLSEGGSPRQRVSAPDAQILFDSLRNSLLEVDAGLGAPGLGWLNNAASPLGGTVEDVLGRVLDEDLQRELRRRGEARVQSQRDMLRTMVASGNVPLLQYSDYKFSLAPKMALLLRQVEAFLARPFMVTPPVQMALLPPDPGRPMVWDGNRLNEAIQMADDYLSFTTQDLSKFPVSLKDPALALAAARLGEVVDGAVSNAAKPANATGLPEGLPFDLRAEVRSLASARPAINHLGDSLHRADFDLPAARLDDLATRQAERLLAEVDRQPIAQAAFAPMDMTFDWWDGTVPFAARAYGVTTIGELQAMLAADRAAIDQLGRDYAEPLVKVLTERGAGGLRPSMSRVHKWQGIQENLARYQQEDPASSLKRLERFILVEMDQIVSGRCASLPIRIAPSDDFFANQLETLRSAIADRCAELGKISAQAGWEAVSRQFNDTLAGRFPFTGSDGAQPWRRRADPDDVRRFFIGTAAQRAAMKPPQGSMVQAFLNQLAADEKALAPMLVDANLPMPLAYEVEVDFRTDPIRDRGANQILDWGVEFGPDQRVSSRDGKHKAVWSAGQPVKLWLRWARNAPNLPASSAHGPAVDGATASWIYDDEWALLTLLARHQPLTLRNDAGDAELVTLQVPQRRNPDAASGLPADMHDAELTLRIKLAAVVRQAGQPEQKLLVKLPPFPSSAPTSLGVTP